MPDEMLPNQTAAAMYGIAENTAFPCEDRLAAALQALNYYAPTETETPYGTAYVTTVPPADGPEPSPGLTIDASWEPGVILIHDDGTCTYIADSVTSVGDTFTPTQHAILNARLLGAARVLERSRRPEVIASFGAVGGTGGGY